MNENNEHKCIGNDELLVQTKTNIATYGLQVIMVSGDNYSPSFAYSIGLFETYRQPEIICFGLPQKLGHEIINDVAALMKNGEVIQPYTNYDTIFQDGRSEFVPVDSRNIDDYFGAGLSYYATIKFPALQLVWADRNNKLPWEKHFEEEFIYKQPLLDRNADFKFRESKNLAVFTTRAWTEEQKPLLHVVHENDGDWQFLTGHQFPRDIRIVGLEQMVLRDKTLNELFNLGYGEEAQRESVGGKWTRNKVEQQEE